MQDILQWWTPGRVPESSGKALGRLWGGSGMTLGRLPGPRGRALGGLQESSGGGLFPLGGAKKAHIFSDLENIILVFQIFMFFIDFC